ncbi:MAG: NusG domain II-containing protein [Fibrobacteria bacterium]
MFLLMLAASAWGFIAFRGEAGAAIQVFIGNKHYGWYKTDGERREVSIPSRIGPVILEVGAGSARIISSPCRNKVCVRTGGIKRAHSEIICMPAQVLVIMEGGAGGREPARKSIDGADAVTY